MSNIKDAGCKTRLHMLELEFSGHVGRTRPRAILLAIITVRKSIQAASFSAFLCEYGLRFQYHTYH